MSTIPPVRVVNACYDGTIDCPFFSWEPWSQPSFRVAWTPGEGTLVICDPQHPETKYPLKDYTMVDTTPDPIGKCSADRGAGYHCWRTKTPARVPAPEWCPLRAGAITVKLAETS